MGDLTSTVAELTKTVTELSKTVGELSKSHWSPFLSVAFGVILGWALGYLGVLLQDRRRRQQIRHDLRESLVVELRHVRSRLAGTVFSITLHLGDATKELIGWVQSALEQDTDLPEIRDVLPMLKQLIESEDLIQASRRLARSREKGLYLPRVSLPFSESSTEALLLLSLEDKGRLLRVRTEFQILNAEIDNATFFFKQTLNPSVMDVNAPIINGNLNDAYAHVRLRCQKAVSRIDEFLGKAEAAPTAAL